jgi:CubicO group peptidase (beta-lactamase class C family)
MRLNGRVAVLGPLFAIGCVSAPRTRETFRAVSETEVLGDSLRTLFESFVDSGGAPAAGIAIGRGNRIILAYATGAADGERRVPASIHTQYRVGSISKLFTVAAGMRLARRNVLDWDDTVGARVPELLPEARTITLRQLAGHVSGIRHYAGSEFINTRHFDSIAPTLNVFRRDTLLFAPGARYFYSSYGYNLLGLSIERAAKKPFKEIVGAEVLRPLGLDDTGLDWELATGRFAAKPYEINAGAVRPATAVDLSDRVPSGGYVSCVIDLARFGMAFARPAGYLPDSLVEEMTAIQRLSTGAPTTVGLGWRVGTDSAGRRIWHHAGSSAGGRSLLVVWPDEDIVVAIAANMFVNLSERTAFRFGDLARVARAASVKPTGA